MFVKMKRGGQIPSNLIIDVALLILIVWSIDSSLNSFLASCKPTLEQVNNGTIMKRKKDNDTQRDLTYFLNY